MRRRDKKASQLVSARRRLRRAGLLLAGFGGGFCLLLLEGIVGGLSAFRFTPAGVKLTGSGLFESRLTTLLILFGLATLLLAREFWQAYAAYRSARRREQERPFEKEP